MSRKRKKIPNSVKKAVKLRANHLCEYCIAAENYSPSTFACDHIDPNGDDSLANLANACFSCNGAKYDKTTCIDPLTKVEVTIYNPRMDKWTDHFEWNSDATQI